MQQFSQKNPLNEYYSKRAQEYDSIYKRPIKVRLKEQQIIADFIQKKFKDKFVLELACGTGFWTKYLVKSASKILASDYSLEMLQIASGLINKKNIIFIQADAYNPPLSEPKFEGLMVNFWFSHIPKIKIKDFLEEVHKRVRKDGFVMFCDGVYREELGGKLIIKKGEKDTYKLRKLQNGEEYEILKNYYSKEELLQIFSKYSRKLEIKYLTHFWVVGYYL
jgi:ubiquinone/menaquinone biosynthesis C-methylase UbiE